MRSLFVKLNSALTMSLLLALPAAAQFVPLPASDTKAPVICTGCTGMNAHQQNNDGLKLTPFSSPIAKHVGRLVDSSSTQSYQHIGFRTARGGKIMSARSQRGSAPPRMYMRMGEAIFAWTLGSFFTTALPGGMTTVNNLSTGSKYGSPRSPIFEKILMPDAFVYPEAKGSGWTPMVGDDQNTFGDMDFDDRGYVYSAMTTHGWGVLRDAGETGASQLALTSPQMSGNYNPEIIVALKAGSSYYAAIGDTNATEIMLFDVTTASNPIQGVTRKGRQWGMRLWAKNASGTRIAYVDGDNKLRVYDAATYVSGGAPITQLSPSASREIQDIDFDEAGNIWLAEGYDTAPMSNVLRKLTPSGGSYTETTYNVYGEDFSAIKMHVADGYIIASGWAGSGADASLDVKLFKIETAGPREIPLGKYFAKHYHRAPSGFAQPQVYPSGYCSTPSLSDVHIIKWGGKLYAMYNAWGIGDVYEIDGGGAISANMKTASYGTLNPYSKGTSGPYWGDIVTFNATSSVPGSAGLLWDFGNPESGTGSNSGNSSNGADIQHQYTGLSTASAIATPKTVTVYETNDQSITATIPVTLAVPVPRIGLPGGTALTASSTSVDVVAGETFTDASDGSIESHFATWSIDGVPSNAQPNSTFPVGAIGQHTVTFYGSYGHYNSSSFVSSGTPYVTPTLSVTYNARPFVFGFKAATKVGNDVKFGATARKTSDLTLLPATQWTAAWSLQKNGTDVVPPQSTVVAVGTVPDYTVSGGIPDGSVLQLKLSVDASLLPPAVVPYAEYVQSMTLEAPDPKITKSGCANALAECSFTAGSVAGKPMTDWTLSWSLLLNGSEVGTGTGATYSPNISTAGTYTVKLKATKAIFDTVAEQTVTVAATLCGPPVPAHDISIHASCSTNCAKNTNITFNAQPFQYQAQDCDEWVWTWGDGQTETIKGKFGWLGVHKYASDGPYQIKLTAKNSQGQTVVTPINITVGSDTPPPPPPPTCSAPTSASFTYTGSKGCRTGVDCKVGESISFSPRKNGGSLHDCDSTVWNFGDSTSSSKNPSKTFNSTGSKTITLTINNSKGTVEHTASINIVPDGSTSCERAPSSDGFYLFFRGRDSGCSYSNNRICEKGEIIDFRALEYGSPFPTFQGCDRFEWKFGDGGTATSAQAEHAYNGNGDEFEVSIRVFNTIGSAELKALVRFTGAPIVEAPVLTSNFVKTGAKGVPVTFTVESNMDTTTGWTWDFGDGTPKDTSQASLVQRTSTISHVFATAGPRTVTVSARNSLATSTALTAVASDQVVISDVPMYRFLLPAVIHDDGLNGSTWRTDVQVYYGAPNPATEPLEMTASFNGTETQLEINKATFIYSDFVLGLTGGANGKGAVILTTQTPYKPQIWTRTYTIEPSGKTFGQFIPAIELTETTGNSTVSPNADPTKYYLSGLRHDARYRTNLGFINITTSDILADVTAYDDLRTPLDHFTITLPPFTLTPYSVSKIKNVSNRPVSLVITVPAGKKMVGYASLIDGASNDPVYISAVSNTELADFATSITPGVGHIGAWRSDVTIFNPDDRDEVKFDLEYFDNTGLSQGLATNVTLGRLQAKNYGDLLREASLFTPAPPDGVGMLKLTTRTQQSVYPLTFSRTYNDKGAGGTFGQGIFGIAPSRANVIPGKSAIIAGVRSGTDYRTNIGLTNTTANAVAVKVQLLDPTTGGVANEQGYTLAGYASFVGPYPFGNLTTGAFRIEITGGSGAVWAFASVIDAKSEDPEYVPAELIP